MNRTWMFRIALALALLSLVFQDVVLLVFGLMFSIAGIILERDDDVV